MMARAKRRPSSTLEAFTAARGRLPACAVALVLAGCNCGGNGDNGPGNGNDVLAGPGEPCPSGDPGRCASGVHLFGEGGQCWCSAYCSSHEDCPEGFPCQVYPFDGDQREICAPECERDGQCSSGSCDPSTGVCDPLSPGEAELGDECGAGSGTCAPSLICVRHGGPGRCMETCDLAEGPLCESTAVCYEAMVPSGGICWLGGELALDTPCAGEFDCMMGLVCVSHLGEQSCRPACDTEASEPCEEGTETCRPLGDGRLGACLP